MKIRAPRLLPVTMVAMATVLAVKSVALVRAAIPAQAVLATNRINDHETLSSSPAGQSFDASVIPDDVHMARPDSFSMSRFNVFAEAAAAPPATAKPMSGSSPSSRAPSEASPASVPSPSPSGATVPALSTQPAAISDSERAILLDLRARREAIDAREAALQARQQLLDATGTRLAAQAAELTALEAKLEALEAGRAQRDDANWKSTVKVYEAMKSRDAAAIFNDLDMPVLLQIVDRMNERKVSAVLGAMLPERARLLTAELANMRANNNRIAAPTVPAVSTPPSSGIRPAGSGGSAAPAGEAITLPSAPKSAADSPVPPAGPTGLQPSAKTADAKHG